MATAAQVIDRLAPMTGLLPSTLDRLLRALRAEGMIPTAGKGGGKNSVHLDAVAMTNVLLGLAGPQPSDGPEAVRTLRGLVYTASQETGQETEKLAYPLGIELGTLLESIINNGPQVDTHSTIFSTLGWELTLCLDPAWAFIRLSLGDTRLVHDFYLPNREERPLPELRRLTKLSMKLIMAAAEMVEEAEQVRSTPSLPHIEAAPGSASSEHENAGYPLAGAPAPLGNQSRANGSGGTTTPDIIPERDRFQGYGAERTGCLHPSLKEPHHGRSEPPCSH